MKTQLTLQPSKITPDPSLDKYYGVHCKGYEKGQLRDRAFIVGENAYPKPKSFRVVNINGATKANTWDCLDNMRNPTKSISLHDYIVEVMKLGFIVQEFDSAHELAQWLSEARE